MALPSEPLLISSSCDNTVKMWIFDMPDGGARLLRWVMLFIVDVVVADAVDVVSYQFLQL